MRHIPTELYGRKKYKNFVAECFLKICNWTEQWTTLYFRAKRCNKSTELCVKIDGSQFNTSVISSLTYSKMNYTLFFLKKNCCTATRVPDGYRGCWLKTATVREWRRWPKKMFDRLLTMNVRLFFILRRDERCGVGALPLYAKNRSSIIPVAMSIGLIEAKKGAKKINKYLNVAMFVDRKDCLLISLKPASLFNKKSFSEIFVRAVQNGRRN